ncbi:MAG: 3-deoxy-7-phosphoheptulonate synthase, partial [Defluviitaleaceae bacterium]|nr:3-deoxy-7-phosphoheptulonate synthase [Defluviitaleaceae bacterium]
MVVVLKPDVTQEKTDQLIHWLKEKQLEVREFHGREQCVLGLIGNTSAVDADMLKSLDIVESVANVSDPFKAVNRKIHPDDTVINPDGGGHPAIGGGHFALIAGPCSVESEDQIIQIAEQVKTAGANFLRGGAFKPRTSPYDFQGLGDEGIKLLLKAKQITGLPIVTELMELRSLHLFEDIDVIQVGARNTQNYDLLKELGKMKNTILLKRGLAG